MISHVWNVIISRYIHFFTYSPISLTKVNTIEMNLTQLLELLNGLWLNILKILIFSAMSKLYLN